MPAEVFQGKVIGRGSDGERKAQPLGRPHPGAGHVVVPVPHEGDFHILPRTGAVDFLNGKQVRQNLAGVLLVRQGIDGGNAGKAGEFLHFLLSVSPDGGAVDHTSQHAGRILDGLSTPELDVMDGKEHGTAPQFTDAHFKGNAGAGGGFGKDERPGLPLQGKAFVMAAFRLKPVAQGEQVPDFVSGKLFDGKEVVHGF